LIRDKHILVAVLNWGLGHATRSIPIIRLLLSQNNHISIASDGAALTLLQSTFPDLTSLELPGYDVTYPTSNMVWNIGSQFFKIKRAITEEQLAIQKWVRNNRTDIIISDNRYGCHHYDLHNILISHQLNLQLPFASRLINRIHAKQLQPFSEIWVPDDEHRTFSNELSNPKWLDPSVTIKYFGTKSRLKKINVEKEYNIAAILSGPEPQRTIFEKKLSQQLSEMNLKSIIVQGSKSAKTIPSTENVEIIQFADQERLSEIVCGSQMIVCRSGYSTIMDLSKLGGRALFIPTPGQTEQIYLAEHFQNKKMAQFQSQNNLDVERAWNKKDEFKGF